MDAAPDDFPSLDALVDAAVAALPRGRRGASAPSFLREILPEDLSQILFGQKSQNPAVRPLAKVRNTHHQAARLLAEGRSVVETAEITGYTPQRISDLKNDPTFQNLVAHYRDQVQAKWLNVHERLQSLGIAVTEELQERLEEAPEKFTNEELRRWAETLLDRSGNGPSATRNVNVRSQNATLHLVELIKRETEETVQVKLLQAAE